MLAAHKLDREAGEPAPGRRLRGVIRCLGGAKADAASHANVVARFLKVLWRSKPLAEQRNPATSAVVRQLLRERTHDYREILVYLKNEFGGTDDLSEYLHDWAVGHFLMPG